MTPASPRWFATVVAEEEDAAGVDVVVAVAVEDTAVVVVDGLDRTLPLFLTTVGVRF